MGTHAEQFAALRQVSELTPAACRKVIGVLHEGQGKRTCARRQHSHAASFPCLRSLSVPGTEDATAIKVPCMSLPALIEAKVQACPTVQRIIAQGVPEASRPADSPMLRG